MRFEEQDYLDITNIPVTFIYFLLDEGEVVYVGQTTRGIARILAHVGTKKFNEVKIISCKAEELDRLEDFHIKKYCPIYNKNYNKKENLTVSKCINEIHELYGGCSVSHFVRMLQYLNIKINEFKNLEYITRQDFNKVCDGIENYLIGVDGYEIFSVRVQSRKVIE